jgi:ubiquinone/menaquinone biosynthesis C-methylase UbiE
MDPMTDTYMLGHSALESERLIEQAKLLAPITKRFLQEAGIRPGMRVLDVGSGMGDVAMLAAELVGPGGDVVGIDTSADAMAAASARSSSAPGARLRFITGDPAVLAFEHPFDAIVGRYVLLFQKDPATMLGALRPKLAQGGVIAFHELDWQGARSFPPAPNFDQCCRWAAEALRLGGADPHVGSKLYSAFIRAGFPPPTMRVEAIAGGVGDPSGAIRKLFSTIFPETFVHTLVNHGIATAAQIDFASLPDRLCAEIEASNGAIIGRSEVGIWAHHS